MSKADWTMREWRDYYENLRQKAYMDYQETGESRYDRRELQYAKIVDAFNGYLDFKDEEDHERLRRKRNIESYADRYVNKENFSKNEVLKLIRDISTC